MHLNLVLLYINGGHIRFNYTHTSLTTLLVLCCNYTQSIDKSCWWIKYIYYIKDLGVCFNNNFIKGCYIFIVIMICVGECVIWSVWCVGEFKWDQFTNCSCLIALKRIASSWSAMRNSFTQKDESLFSNWKQGSMFRVIQLSWTWLF